MKSQQLSDPMGQLIKRQIIQLTLLAVTIALSLCTIGGAYATFSATLDTRDNTDNILTEMQDQAQTISQLGQLNENADKALSRKYRVQYVTAPQDQGERGTCWDFSTIHTLESAYMAQGQQYLPENTYVKFSEQAHGVNIIDYCTENPEKCPDTQNGVLNTATDGYPSWIFHFGDYLDSRLVVDLPECPYTPLDDGEDHNCDGMYEFQNAKRLLYNVTNYKQLHQINDIKEALTRHNYALPLVTELYYEYYYIPCDTDQYIGQTTECTTKATSCPQNLQSEKFDRFCYQQGFITSADAEFYARNNQQTKQVSIGAHAMSIVAYNDDYRGRFSNQKGAFIVKNSWGTTLGHSLQYLMGDISFRDEEYICPNINNPWEWVPVNYEGEDKYKLRSTTWLRFVDYKKPGHFHVDDHTTYSEAIAQLNLNASHLFAINNYMQWTDETVKIEMMDCEEQNINDTSKCTLIQLPPCKFDYLVVVFEPYNVDATATENYPECGFYAIPYAFAEYTVQNHGLWFVDEMDVQFDKSSYLTEEDDLTVKANKQLKDAQREYKEFKFVSHTPWLDDYTQQPRFK